MPNLNFEYKHAFQPDDRSIVHHADVMKAFVPRKAVFVNFEYPGTARPTTSNTAEATIQSKPSVGLKLNTPSFAATPTTGNVRDYLY